MTSEGQKVRNIRLTKPLPNPTVGVKGAASTRESHCNQLYSLAQLVAGRFAVVAFLSEPSRGHRPRLLSPAVHASIFTQQGFSVLEQNKNVNILYRL